MTTEDQIKDEKLQYDINREAAKISALSSGKIDKYEYLTGEEILPSNQQQIIEQAKFTYSPLGKASENRKQLISDDDYKNKLLTLKEREIFKDIYNKRHDKLEELNNKIDYDDLKYVVESSGDEYSFNKVKDPISLLNKIKNVKYH